MNKVSSGWARPLKCKKKNLKVDRPRALGYSGIMKEIIVRGKKVKVPFEDADYRLDGEQDVELQNPFSGEKATVPGYAAAVYDVIKGAEVTHNYDMVQKGCDWFSRNFPKQYMVLLD